MTSILFEFAELVKLQADLYASTPKVAAAVAVATTASGEALKPGWASIATATAGRHGVHYPSAITSEVHSTGLSTTATVGPESGREQGGMSFEYGSMNQPPHLDGQKATDIVEPAFLAAITKVGSAALSL